MSKLIPFLFVALSISLFINMQAFPQISTGTGTNESRAPAAVFSAVYSPSIAGFGVSEPVTYWPFFDNFSACGSFNDLLPDSQGPDLDLNSGFSHYISMDQYVNPDGLAESADWLECPQSYDMVYLNAKYIFLDYFSFAAGINYIQNRTLIATNYDSSLCDYNITSPGLVFTVDMRHSSLEHRKAGMALQYPDDGFISSTELTYNSGYDFSTGQSSCFITISNDTAFYFHPADEWVLYLDINGEGLTAPAPLNQYKLLSMVVGGYQVAGDYNADYTMEARFLSGWSGDINLPGSRSNDNVIGLSPGVIIGYNGGVTGNYTNHGMVNLQSFYISPDLAIKNKGALLALFALDFAVSTSHIYNIVLSCNYALGAGKPNNHIFMTGIN